MRIRSYAYLALWSTVNEGTPESECECGPFGKR